MYAELQIQIKMSYSFTEGYKWMQSTGQRAITWIWRWPLRLIESWMMTINQWLDRLRIYCQLFWYWLIYWLSPILKQKCLKCNHLQVWSDKSCNLKASKIDQMIYWFIRIIIGKFINNSFSKKALIYKLFLWATNFVKPVTEFLTLRSLKLFQ